MTVKFNYITGLIILWLAAGCKKEPTTWDTNYKVPLIEGQLDPTYLYDQEIAEENQDSSIRIHWIDEIVNYNIDSLYEIPDTTLIKNFSSSISLTAPAGFEFFTDNDDLEFDVQNEVKLSEVSFSEGEIEISVNNPIETDVFVTLQLPGVQKNGNSISINARVPKMENGTEGSFDTIIPVQGYIFDLTGSSGSSSNSLASNINLKTDPNGPDVTINNQDLFKTNLALNNLNSNYAKGYFGQHNIEEVSHFNIDFLKRFTSGSIALDSLDLKVTVKNGFKLLASARINELAGFNTRTSNQVVFSHPQVGSDININPALNGWQNLVPSEFLLNITNINSNITDFIEVLPDSLTYNIEAIINPLGNVSGGNDVAFPLSRFIIEADLSFPAKMAFNELTFNDTFDISFERDEASTHLNNFELKVVTENSLPLNGTLSLTILNADGSSSQVQEEMLITSPAVLNTGKTEGVVTTEAIFILTEDQTRSIALEDTKLIIEATMETSGGNQQVFYSNQMIKYRIFGNAGLQIKI